MSRAPTSPHTPTHPQKKMPKEFLWEPKWRPGKTPASSKGEGSADASGRVLKLDGPGFPVEGDFRYPPMELSLKSIQMVRDSRLDY